MSIGTNIAIDNPELQTPFQGLFDQSLQATFRKFTQEQFEDSSRITDTSKPIQNIFLNSKIVGYFQNASRFNLSDDIAKSGLTYLSHGADALTEDQKVQVLDELEAITQPDRANELSLTASEQEELQAHIRREREKEAKKDEEARISDRVRHKLLIRLQQEKIASLKQEDGCLSGECCITCEKFLLGQLKSEDMTLTEKGHMEAYLQKIITAESGFLNDLSVQELTALNALKENMGCECENPMDVAKSLRESLQEGDVNPYEEAYRRQTHLINGNHHQIDEVMDALFQDGTLSADMTDEELAHEVLEWVKNKVEYESDDIERDHWQSIDETFSRLAGDCEDLSILVGSLMTNGLQRLGHSKHEARNRVQLTAGYVTISDGSRRGHMRVELKSATGNEDDTLVMDATATHGVQRLNHDTTATMDAVFHMLEGGTFKALQEITRDFHTAISLGTSSYASQLTVLATRLDTVRRIIETPIEVPRIQGEDLFKNLTARALGRSTHGFPTSSSSLGNYYILNSNDKLVSLSTRQDVIDRLYNSTTGILRNYATADPATQATIKTNLQTYLREERVNIFEKLDSSSSSGVAFEFFTIKRRQLSEADVAPSITVTPLLLDLSAIPGLSAANTNVPNPLNYSFFEAELNYGAYFAYLNNINRNMNYITMLYYGLTTLFDQTMDESVALETMSDSDQVKQILTQAVRDGGRYRSKIGGALSALQQKLADGVQDISDQMFEFVNSVNTAMYRSVELEIEQEFRGSFGEALGSALGDELVGVFEQMRQDAHVRLYTMQSILNAKNDSAYLQMTLQFTENIIQMEYVDERGGVQRDQTPTRIHTGTLRSQDVNLQRRQGTDGFTYISGYRTLKAKLLEAAVEIGAGASATRTTTGPDERFTLSFNLDPAGSNSIVGKVLQSFNVERASDLTRFGNFGNESSHHTLDGRIFASAQGLSAAGTSAPTRSVYLDYNYTKQMMLRDLLAQAQNRMRLALMLDQLVLHATLIEVTGINPDVTTPESLNAMRQAASAILDTEMSKQASLMDSFISMGSELTASVNNIVRHQNALKNASVTGKYKQLRTAGLVTAYGIALTSSPAQASVRAPINAASVCSPLIQPPPPAGAGMVPFNACAVEKTALFTASWTQFYIFQRTTMIDAIEANLFQTRMTGLQYEVSEGNLTNLLQNPQSGTTTAYGFGDDEQTTGAVQAARDEGEVGGLVSDGSTFHTVASSLETKIQSMREELRGMKSDTTLSQGKNLGTWDAKVVAGFLKERGDGHAVIDGIQLAAAEERLSEIQATATLIFAIQQSLLAATEQAANELSGMEDINVTSQFQPFFDSIMSKESAIHDAYRMELQNNRAAITDTAHKSDAIHKQIISSTAAAAKLPLPLLALIETYPTGTGVAEAYYTAADLSFETTQIQINAFSRPFTGFWSDYHSEGQSGTGVGYLGLLRDSLDSALDSPDRDRTSAITIGTRDPVVVSPSSWTNLSRIEDQYMYHIFGDTDLSFTTPGTGSSSASQLAAVQQHTETLSTQSTARLEAEITALTARRTRTRTYLTALRTLKTNMEDEASWQPLPAVPSQEHRDAVTAEIRAFTTTAYPQFGTDHDTPITADQAVTDRNITAVSTEIGLIQTELSRIETSLSTAQDNLNDISARAGSSVLDNQIQTLEAQVTAFDSFRDKLIERDAFTGLTDDSSTASYASLTAELNAMAIAADMRGYGEALGTSAREVITENDIAAARRLSELKASELQSARRSGATLSANSAAGTAPTGFTTAGLNRIHSIQQATSGNANLFGYNLSNYAEVNYQPIIDSRKNMAKIFTIRAMFAMLEQAFFQSTMDVFRDMGVSMSYSDTMSAFMSAIDTFNAGKTKVIDSFAQEATSRVESYSSKFISEQGYAIDMAALGAYGLTIPTLGRLVGRFGLKHQLASMVRQIAAMSMQIHAGRVAIDGQKRQMPKTSSLLFGDPDIEDRKENLSEKERKLQSEGAALGQGTDAEVAARLQARNAQYNEDLAALNNGTMTITQMNNKYNTNFENTESARSYLQERADNTSGVTETNARARLAQEVATIGTAVTAVQTSLAQLDNAASARDLGFSSDFKADTHSTGKGTVTADPSVRIRQNLKIRRRALQQKTLMSIVGEMLKETQDEVNEMSGSNIGFSTQQFLKVVNIAQQTDMALTDLMNQALEAKVSMHNQAMDKIFEGAIKGIMMSAQIALSGMQMGLSAYKKRRGLKMDIDGMDTSQMSAAGLEQLGSTTGTDIAELTLTLLHRAMDTSAVVIAHSITSDKEGEGESDGDDTGDSLSPGEALDYVRDDSDTFQQLTDSGNIETANMEASMEAMMLKGAAAQASKAEYKQMELIGQAFASILKTSMASAAKSAIDMRNKRKTRGQMKDSMRANQQKAVDIMKGGDITNLVPAHADASIPDGMLSEKDQQKRAELISTLSEKHGNGLAFFQKEFTPEAIAHKTVAAQQQGDLQQLSKLQGDQTPAGKAKRAEIEERLRLADDYMMRTNVNAIAHPDASQDAIKPSTDQQNVARGLEARTGAQANLTDFRQDVSLVGDGDEGLSNLLDTSGDLILTDQQLTRVEQAATTAKQHTDGVLAPEDAKRIASETTVFGDVTDATGSVTVDQDLMDIQQEFSDQLDAIMPIAGGLLSDVDKSSLAVDFSSFLSSKSLTKDQRAAAQHAFDSAMTDPGDKKTAFQDAIRKTTFGSLNHSAGHEILSRRLDTSGSGTTEKDIRKLVGIDTVDGKAGSALSDDDQSKMDKLGKLTHRDFAEGSDRHLGTAKRGFGTAIAAPFMLLANTAVHAVGAMAGVIGMGFAGIGGLFVGMAHLFIKGLNKLTDNYFEKSEESTGKALSRIGRAMEGAGKFSKKQGYRMINPFAKGSAANAVVGRLYSSKKAFDPDGKHTSDIVYKHSPERVAEVLENKTGLDEKQSKALTQHLFNQRFIGPSDPDPETGKRSFETGPKVLKTVQNMRKHDMLDAQDRPTEKLLRADFDQGADSKSARLVRPSYFSETEDTADLIQTAIDAKGLSATSQSLRDESSRMVMADSRSFVDSIREEALVHSDEKSDILTELGSQFDHYTPDKNPNAKHFVIGDKATTLETLSDNHNVGAATHIPMEFNITNAAGETTTALVYVSPESSLAQAPDQVQAGLTAQFGEGHTASELQNPGHVDTFNTEHARLKSSKSALKEQTNMFEHVTQFNGSLLTTAEKRDARDTVDTIVTAMEEGESSVSNTDLGILVDSRRMDLVDNVMGGGNAEADIREAFLKSENLDASGFSSSVSQGDRLAFLEEVQKTRVLQNRPHESSDIRRIQSELTADSIPGSGDAPLTESGQSTIVAPSAGALMEFTKSDPVPLTKSEARHLVKFVDERGIAEDGVLDPGAIRTELSDHIGVDPNPLPPELAGSDRRRFQGILTRFRQSNLAQQRKLDTVFSGDSPQTKALANRLFTGQGSDQEIATHRNALVAPSARNNAYLAGIESDREARRSSEGASHEIDTTLDTAIKRSETNVRDVRKAVHSEAREGISRHDDPEFALRAAEKEHDSNDLRYSTSVMESLSDVVFGILPTTTEGWINLPGNIVGGAVGIAAGILGGIGGYIVGGIRDLGNWMTGSESKNYRSKYASEAASVGFAGGMQVGHTLMGGGVRQAYTSLRTGENHFRADTYRNFRKNSLLDANRHQNIQTGHRLATSTRGALGRFKSDDILHAEARIANKAETAAFHDRFASMEIRANPAYVSEGVNDSFASQISGAVKKIHRDNTPSDLAMVKEQTALYAREVSNMIREGRDVGATLLDFTDRLSANGLTETEINQTMATVMGQLSTMFDHSKKGDPQAGRKLEIALGQVFTHADSESGSGIHKKRAAALAVSMTNVGDNDLHASMRTSQIKGGTSQGGFNIFASGIGASKSSTQTKLTHAKGLSSMISSFSSEELSAFKENFKGDSSGQKARRAELFKTLKSEAQGPQGKERDDASEALRRLGENFFQGSGIEEESLGEMSNVFSRDISQESIAEDLSRLASQALSPTPPQDHLAKDMVSFERDILGGTSRFSETELDSYMKSPGFFELIRNGILSRNAEEQEATFRVLDAIKETDPDNQKGYFDSIGKFLSNDIDKDSIKANLKSHAKGYQGFSAADAISRSMRQPAPSGMLSPDEFSHFMRQRDLREIEQLVRRMGYEMDEERRKRLGEDVYSNDSFSAFILRDEVRQRQVAEITAQLLLVNEDAALDFMGKYVESVADIPGAVDAFGESIAESGRFNTVVKGNPRFDKTFKQKFEQLDLRIDKRTRDRFYAALNFAAPGQAQSIAPRPPSATQLQTTFSSNSDAKKITAVDQFSAYAKSNPTQAARILSDFIRVSPNHGLNLAENVMAALPQNARTLEFVQGMYQDIGTDSGFDHISLAPTGGPGTPLALHQDFQAFDKSETADQARETINTTLTKLFEGSKARLESLPQEQVLSTKERAAEGMTILSQSLPMPAYTPLDIAPLFLNAHSQLGTKYPGAEPNHRVYDVIDLMGQVQTEIDDTGAANPQTVSKLKHATEWLPGGLSAHSEISALINAVAPERNIEANALLDVAEHHFEAGSEFGFSSALTRLDDGLRDPVIKDALRRDSQIQPDNTIRARTDAELRTQLPKQLALLDHLSSPAMAGIAIPMDEAKEVLRAGLKSSDNQVRAQAQALVPKMIDHFDRLASSLEGSVQLHWDTAHGVVRSKPEHVEAALDMLHQASTIATNGLDLVSLARQERVPLSKDFKFDSIATLASEFKGAVESSTTLNHSTFVSDLSGRDSHATLDELQAESSEAYIDLGHGLSESMSGHAAETSYLGPLARSAIQLGVQNDKFKTLPSPDDKGDVRERKLKESITKLDPDELMSLAEDHPDMYLQLVRASLETEFMDGAPLPGDNVRIQANGTPSPMFKLIETHSDLLFRVMDEKAAGAVQPDTYQEVIDLIATRPPGHDLQELDDLLQFLGAAGLSLPQLSSYSLNADMSRDMIDRLSEVRGHRQLYNMSRSSANIDQTIAQLQPFSVSKSSRLTGMLDESRELLKLESKHKSVGTKYVPKYDWASNLYTIRQLLRGMKQEVVASGAISEYDFDTLIDGKEDDAAKQLVQTTKLLSDYYERAKDLPTANATELTQLSSIIDNLSVAALHLHTHNDFLDRTEHRTGIETLLKTLNTHLSNNTGAHQARTQNLLHQIMHVELRQQTQLESFYGLFETAGVHRQEYLMNIAPHALPLTDIHNASDIIPLMDKGLLHPHEVMELVAQDPRYGTDAEIRTAQVGLMNRIQRDHEQTGSLSTIDAQSYVDSLDEQLVDLFRHVQDLAGMTPDELDSLSFLSDGDGRLQTEKAALVYKKLHVDDINMPGTFNARDAFDAALQNYDAVRSVTTGANVSGYETFTLPADVSVVSRGSIIKLSSSGVSSTPPPEGADSPSGASAAARRSVFTSPADVPAGRRASLMLTSDVYDVKNRLEAIAVELTQLAHEEPTLETDLKKAVLEGELSHFIKEHLEHDHHNIAVYLPTLMGNPATRTVVDNLLLDSRDADPSSPADEELFATVNVSAPGETPEYKRMRFSDALVYVLDVPGNHPRILDSHTTSQLIQNKAFRDSVQDLHTREGKLNNPTLILERAFQDPHMEIPFGTMSDAEKSLFLKRAEKSGHLRALMPRLMAQQAFQDHVKGWLSHDRSTGGDAALKFDLGIKMLNHMDQTPYFISQILQQRLSELNDPADQAAFLKNTLGNPDFLYGRQDRAYALRQVSEDMVRLAATPALDISALTALLTSRTHIPVSDTETDTAGIFESSKSKTEGIPADVKRSVAQALASQGAFRNPENFGKETVAATNQQLDAFYTDLDRPDTVTNGYRRQLAAAHTNQIAHSQSVMHAQLLHPDSATSLNLADRLLVLQGIGSMQDGMFDGLTPDNIITHIEADSPTTDGSRGVMAQLDRMAMNEPDLFVKVMESSPFKDIDPNLLSSQRSAQLETSMDTAISRLDTKTLNQLAAQAGTATSPTAALLYARAAQGASEFADAHPLERVDLEIGNPADLFRSALQLARSDVDRINAIETLNATNPLDLDKLLLADRTDGHSFGETVQMLTGEVPKDRALRQQHIEATLTLNTIIANRAAELAESGLLSNEAFVNLIDNVSGVIPSDRVDKLTEAHTRSSGAFKSASTKEKVAFAASGVGTALLLLSAVGYMLRQIPLLGQLVPDIVTWPIDFMLRSNTETVKKKGTTDNQKYSLFTKSYSKGGDRFVKNNLGMIVKSTVESDASHEAKLSILRYYAKNPKANLEIMRYLERNERGQALHQELVLDSIRSNRADKDYTSSRFSKTDYTGINDIYPSTANAMFNPHDPMVHYLIRMIDRDTDGSRVIGIMERLDPLDANDQAAKKYLLDLTAQGFHHQLDRREPITKLDSDTPKADVAKKVGKAAGTVPLGYYRLMVSDHSRNIKGNTKKQVQSFMNDYRQAQDPKAWIQSPENRHRLDHIFDMLKSIDPVGSHKSDVFKEFFAEMNTFIGLRDDDVDLANLRAEAYDPHTGEDVIFSHIYRALKNNEIVHIAGRYYPTENYDPEYTFDSDDPRMTDAHRDRLREIFEPPPHAQIIVDYIAEHQPAMISTVNDAFGVGHRGGHHSYAQVGIESAILKTVVDEQELSAKGEQEMLQYLQSVGRITSHNNAQLAHRAPTADMLIPPGSARFKDLPAYEKTYLSGLHIMLDIEAKRDPEAPSAVPEMYQGVVADMGAALPDIVKAMKDPSYQYSYGKNPRIDAYMIRTGAIRLDSSKFAEMSKSDQFNIQASVRAFQQSLKPGEKGYDLFSGINPKTFVYVPGKQPELDAFLVEKGVLKQVPTSATKKQLDIPLDVGVTPETPLSDEVLSQLQTPNQGVRRAMNGETPFTSLRGGTLAPALANQFEGQFVTYQDNITKALSEGRHKDASQMFRRAPFLNPKAPYEMRAEFFKGMLAPSTHEQAKLSPEMEAFHSKAAEFTIKALMSEVRQHETTPLSITRRAQIRESLELFQTYAPATFEKLMDQNGARLKSAVLKEEFGFTYRPELSTGFTSQLTGHEDSLDHFVGVHPDGLGAPPEQLDRNSFFSTPFLALDSAKHSKDLDASSRADSVHETVANGLDERRSQPVPAGQVRSRADAYVLARADAYRGMTGNHEPIAKVFADRMHSTKMHPDGYEYVDVFDKEKVREVLYDLRSLANSMAAQGLITIRERNEFIHDLKIAKQDANAMRKANLYGGPPHVPQSNLFQMLGIVG